MGGTRRDLRQERESRNIGSSDLIIINFFLLAKWKGHITLSEENQISTFCIYLQLWFFTRRISEGLDPAESYKKPA
jgi:hypothetical protein